MFRPEYCTARKVGHLCQERILAGKEISPAKNEVFSPADVVPEKKISTAPS